MKKLIVLLTILASAIAFTGCTQNIRAKTFGGNVNVDGAVGKTVVNMTWKEGNLWVQYRDRTANEKPQIVVFKEYSSFGMLEGTVTVTEK